MSLRVVVCAEGALDIGAPVMRRAPGQGIPDDELGAAHIVIRRCLSANGRVPDAAIRFDEPLRTVTGRPARGSDLLNSKQLRKLLTWPPGQEPDLAVVLVDADGDRTRKATLDAETRTLSQPKVIGVAVEEFEAWLIADDRAVSDALGEVFPTPPAPESMGRQGAKQLLAQAIATARVDGQTVRRSIAALCDLDTTASKCPAFKSFRAELVQAALPP